MRCYLSLIIRAIPVLPKAVPIILLSILTTACAPEAVQHMLPGGPGGGGSICYGGARNSGDSCLPVVSAAAISDPDYKYPDPFTDPTFPAGFNPDLYLPPLRFVDLAAVNIHQEIVPNFEIDEFMSPRKGRYGVFSRHVADIVAQIRRDLNVPVIVTSGYRSQGYNDDIPGAAAWSRHRHGDAVDISSRVYSRKTLRDKCRQYGSSFERMYSGWVHCDWRHLGGDPFFINDGSISFALTTNSNNLPLVTYSIEKLYGRHESVTLREIAENHGRDRIVFQIESDIEDVAGDHGKMINIWTITTPSGEVIEQESSEVNLPREVGVYQVTVEVGGSYEVSDLEFEVKPLPSDGT